MVAFREPSHCALCRRPLDGGYFLPDDPMIDWAIPAVQVAAGDVAICRHCILAAINASARAQNVAALSPTEKLILERVELTAALKETMP